MAEKFNFLGQEEQTDLGLNWLTFRYRNYMPEIGRFFGVDPIAEEFFSISNYQFAHNSPISKIELEGLEGKNVNPVPETVNHEPVKLIDNIGTAAYKGSGGFKEVKVVQELTKKQVKRKIIAEAIKGPLKFIAPLARIGFTNLGIFLTPATAHAPNVVNDIPIYSTEDEGSVVVNKPKVDEKFQVDDKEVKVEGENDSPIQREGDQTSEDSDSSKNEKHGDRGRTLTKAEKQIEAYKKQLEGANKKDRKKILQKIKNVREDAQRKAKGEEHSRTKKG